MKDNTLMELNTQTTLARDAVKYHDKTWFNSLPSSWDPMNNNGDSFELSTRLGICIDHDYNIEIDSFTIGGHTHGEYVNGVEAWIVLIVGDQAQTIKHHEMYADDKMQATRKCVTHVAAKLAKLWSPVDILS